MTQTSSSSANPGKPKSVNLGILIVVNHPERWKLEIPNVKVIGAKEYLTNPMYAGAVNAKVFNLCRSYRYQSLGYYVSLIAEARGHKPQPSVTTIMDFKSLSIIKLLVEDLDETIQSSLRLIQSDQFVLSVYFGRNMAKQHVKLATRLYNLFHAPFIRAHFLRKKDLWLMKSVGPISYNDVPENHKDFVKDAALEYFSKRRWAPKVKASTRYDLAILVDPKEEQPPSNAKAVQMFVKEAVNLGFNTELITKDDIGRLAEFDALFIRTTTSVNHYTYQFARRAAAEGLEVIDDPTSITRCANKVFLAEQLTLHKIPSPKTLIIHKQSSSAVATELGFPCVLKQPDSQFSLGVKRVSDQEELDYALENLFKLSELIVAQEFMQTEFDWRVSVLNREPLFACKYFMAPQHWQVIRQECRGDDRYGEVESVPLARVPQKVLKTALKAANLMGSGLYGVDLKETKDGVFVIEVNDNPNIDHGFEDSIDGNLLYRRVLRNFIERIERKKAAQNHVV